MNPPGFTMQVCLSDILFRDPSDVFPLCERLAAYSMSVHGPAGVADLHRRAQVSQGVNNRFAAAQAAVLSEDATPLKELVASLCQRVVRPGREKSDGRRTRPRTFRALHPLAPEDVHLLTLVSQPKFEISGMRNQDLRPALYRDTPTDPKDQRRQASAVSRKLSLLRAHGILEKVHKSHRYRLTEKGKQGPTALLAAANAATCKLTSLAV